MTPDERIEEIRKRNDNAEYIFTVGKDISFLLAHIAKLDDVVETARLLIDADYYVPNNPRAFHPLYDAIKACDEEIARG